MFLLFLSPWQSQYIFIFDALVEVIETQLKAEEEHLDDNGDEHIYTDIDLTEGNFYANGPYRTYYNQATDFLALSIFISINLLTYLVTDYESSLF